MTDSDSPHTNTARVSASTHLTVADSCTCLTNHVSRVILADLAETPQEGYPIAVADLAHAVPTAGDGGVAPEHRAAVLRHKHLPMLDDRGILDYDHVTDTVQCIDRDAVSTLLDVLSAIEDELGVES